MTDGPSNRAALAKQAEDLAQRAQAMYARMPDGPNKQTVFKLAALAGRIAGIATRAVDDEPPAAPAPRPADPGTSAGA